MYQNISRHNHDISLQLLGLSSQQLRCWNSFPPGFLGDPGYAPYVTVKAPLLVTPPLPAASHCQSFGFRYLQTAPFFLGESTIFRHVSPFFSIYPTGKVPFRASRMTSLRRAQEPPANGGSTGREARPGYQAS